MVDASISFWFAYLIAYLNFGDVVAAPRFTLYGRNLANEAFLGGQTRLPEPLGNFSPLKEGRILGAELRVDWE